MDFKRENRANLCVPSRAHSIVNRLREQADENNNTERHTAGAVPWKMLSPGVLPSERASDNPTPTPRYFWKDVSPFQIPQKFSQFQLWVTRQTSSVVKKSFSSWLKIEYSAEHNHIQTHKSSPSRTMQSSSVPLGQTPGGGSVGGVGSSKLSGTHPSQFRMIWSSLFFKNRL